MTDRQKQIEFLAIEVMGLTCVNNSVTSNEDTFCGDGHMIKRRDFDPFTNIEQAFMLLHKLDQHEYAIVRDCGYRQNKPAEAICNAILQAKGWEDE